MEGVIGLINQSNSCYFNSSLQALLHCSPFIRSTLSLRLSDLTFGELGRVSRDSTPSEESSDGEDSDSDSDSDSRPVTHSSTSSEPVSRATHRRNLRIHSVVAHFLRLVHRYARVSSHYSSIVSTPTSHSGMSAGPPCISKRDLFVAVLCRYGDFSLFEQEDAHEILIRLLDDLDEGTKMKMKTHETTQEFSWISILKSAAADVPIPIPIPIRWTPERELLESSVVKRNFGIRMLSRWKCCLCDTFEDCIEVSTPILSIGFPDPSQLTFDQGRRRLLLTTTSTSMDDYQANANTPGNIVKGALRYLRNRVFRRCCLPIMWMFCHPFLCCMEESDDDMRFCCQDCFRDDVMESDFNRTSAEADGLYMTSTGGFWSTLFAGIGSLGGFNKWLYDGNGISLRRCLDQHFAVEVIREGRSCDHGGVSSLSGDDAESGPISSTEEERRRRIVDEEVDLEEYSADVEVESEEDVLSPTRLHFEKKLHLLKTSDVFVIHMKRFHHSGHYGSKISDKVHFPMTLDISEYFDSRILEEWTSRVRRGTPSSSPPTPSSPESGESEEEGEVEVGGEELEDGEDSSVAYALYDLVGVVNHVGSLHRGHYYAFVKCGRKWYKCDDEDIREVGVGRVRRSQGYILFYERRK